ncbi:MAG: MBL fold metallo-hydrolase [archaeon]
MASIVFLGTGTDPYVIGKRIRGAGGIIIQINDHQFHIDPGVGALIQAAECGVNLRATTAVLVSHNHLYHCNDVNAIIDAMTYSGFDKKGVLIANNTFVNGAEEYKPVLIDYYKNCLERFIVLEPEHKVAIDDIEILAIKTKHTEPKAIGFKFLTSQFTLTYSGDTKYSKEIVESYKNSNILILNVPLSKKDEGTMNLCCEDAVKIIQEVNPRLAIITHFGIDMIKSDPLYEAREIQKRTNVQVIAAKDGMIINPISYSVNLGQKTLKPFSREGVHVEEKKVEIREIKEEPIEKEVVESPEKEVMEGKEEPFVKREEAKEAEESDKSLKDIFLQQ